MKRNIVAGDDYSVLPVPFVLIARKLRSLLHSGRDGGESRSTWLVELPSDEPPCALGATVRFVGLVLGVLQQPVELVVDGFTDCKHLPPATARALATIRALGADQTRASRRGKADPTYMAVRLEADDEAQQRAFIDFAPYSIHAEVHIGRCDVLTIHDSGSSIEVNLTDREHVALVDAPGFADSGARLLRP